MCRIVPTKDLPKVDLILRHYPCLTGWGRRRVARNAGPGPGRHSRSPRNSLSAPDGIARLPLTPAEPRRGPPEELPRRPSRLDEVCQIGQAVTPEKCEPFRLRRLEIRRTEYPADHGPRHGLTVPKPAEPVARLACCFMIDPFEGIHRAVGRLAFHRHHAAVMEADHDIGARVAELALPTELAGARSLIQGRDVARNNFFEADVSQSGP